uniref:Uncharacterized protein n=1 Tax=Romanomermis culicivorax TaxID=13658 RepID=A0A915HU84_ROMCU
MQKAGLYKKCQQCPLLDTYQNEEIEELEMVHKQTTSKQYHNNMLNVPMDAKAGQKDDVLPATL